MYLMLLDIDINFNTIILMKTNDRTIAVQVGFNNQVDK